MLNLLRSDLVRVPVLALSQNRGQGCLLLLKVPVAHGQGGVAEGEKVLEESRGLLLRRRRVGGVKVRYSQPQRSPARHVNPREKSSPRVTGFEGVGVQLQRVRRDDRGPSPCLPC